MDTSRDGTVLFYDGEYDFIDKDSNVIEWKGTLPKEVEERLTTMFLTTQRYARSLVVVGAGKSMLGLSLAIRPWWRAVIRLGHSIGVPTVDGQAFTKDLPRGMAGCHAAKGEKFNAE